MVEDAGMRKLGALRGKVGLVVIGGALLLTGVGVGASMAAGSPGTRPASDTSAVTTTEAPTSTAAPSTPAPVAPAATQPATTSSAAPRAATVTRVTSPDTTSPAAQPDTGAAYTPTQESRPPGAPQGAIGGEAPPAPKLPGEAGYVAPQPTPAG